MNPAGGQVIADEQLIDDELDLFRIQIDVPAPPFLESEIARRFRVNLGIEIVLLGPKRIGGILAFEILHQPRAVKLAMAEVAHQSRQPTAAQEATRIAHWILAANTRP